MRKILFIAVLFVTYNVANAQVAYGVKAGFNYNFADVEKSSNLDSFNPENKAGFNVGAFLRVKIPILGVYVQGEPTYTKLNTGITLDGKPTTLSTNRFDLPVLGGIKMLGLLRLYAGPVFSWNLGSDVDLNSYKVVVEDKSSVGGQVGVGVELWKTDGTEEGTNIVKDILLGTASSRPGNLTHIGQQLYLEATSLGLSATGIGCYLDDMFHNLLGIQNLSYQSLYHFTIGKGIFDSRLTTLEPYKNR